MSYFGLEGAQNTTSLNFLFLFLFLFFTYCIPLVPSMQKRLFIKFDSRVILIVIGFSFRVYRYHPQSLITPPSHTFLHSHTTQPTTHNPLSNFLHFFSSSPTSKPITHLTHDYSSSCLRNKLKLHERAPDLTEIQLMMLMLHHLIYYLKHPRLKQFKFRPPVVHLVRRIKKKKIMKQTKVQLWQIKGGRRGRGKNLLKPLQSLNPTQIRILLVKQKRRIICERKRHILVFMYQHECVC
ncbi:hypothetical protein H5410_059617 [Solanum commersonii]|uniref:Uncharacterized protein n=1 Tax=Solanum commersonii TaxID=4109 RepID=A0A9J5W2V6_SOLCO|nr:hypothetical protein H5410_059617 [Solanum commersonii]